MFASIMDEYCFNLLSHTWALPSLFGCVLEPFNIKTQTGMEFRGFPLDLTGLTNFSDVY